MRMAAQSLADQFDLPTGRLWAADVGQHRYEEVHIIEAGKNYGWDIIEGCTVMSRVRAVTRKGWSLPCGNTRTISVFRSRAVFVYHGDLAPSLAGRYVFADYGTGRIWALAWDGAEAEVEEIMNTSLAISSFGVDAQQELYALAFNGRIYRFTEQSPDP